VLNNGQATLNYAFTVIGTRSIVATYGGDANFNGSSSGVLIQTVN